MTFRTLSIVATLVAIALCTASAAFARQESPRICGTVRAGGWTFHVAEVGLPGCAPARTLTKKLAGLGLAKLPPGRYAGTYLKMSCIGIAAKVGGKSLAHIQCTSRDGRKSLYSTARR